MLWLTFAIAVAATISWCRSMAAMGGMPMPGDWTMSMMWMRMPGQSWPGAAASFLAMWMVMTAAMMLPSFEPMLRGYRPRSSGGGTRWATSAFVAAGYFSVWAGWGAVLFALVAVIAEATMRDAGLARLVPATSAAVVAGAGALQLTAWKARQLTCCRTVTAADSSEVGLRAAWRHGLTLGWICSRCCAGLMAVQMVLGMMDVRVMAAVGVAITAERLAPRGARVARLVGVATLLWAIEIYR